MLHLPLQRPQTMDRESRARDLINRAEIFRARKVRQVKRRLDFGGLGEIASYETVHNLAIMDPRHEQLSGQHNQDLTDKYNFDFEKEEAKEGKYKWETIDPDSEKAQDIPDFYLRPPHKKHKVFRQISTDSDDETSVETSPDLKEKAPRGSNRDSRVPTATATRQLFDDSGEIQGGSSNSLDATTIAQSPLQSSPDPYSQGVTDCCNFGGNTRDISIFTDSIRDADDDVDQPIAIRNGVTNLHHTTPSPPKVSCLQDSAELVKNTEASQRENEVSIKEECSARLDETPSTSSGVFDFDRKRKQSQVTDYFQEKKKCVERVKRKLYEEDNSN